MAVIASRSRRPAMPRTIRLAKPEEGESKGEVLHVLRAMAVVVAFTALVGWLVT